MREESQFVIKNYSKETYLVDDRDGVVANIERRIRVKVPFPTEMDAVTLCWGKSMAVLVTPLDKFVNRSLQLSFN